MTKVISFIFSALMAISPFAMAHTDGDAIHAIKQSWVEAKYEKKGKEQAHAFELLLEDIARLRQESDLPVAVLDCWEGTSLSSYASAVGGTRALSMVKKARGLLENALSADEQVEDGLALGVLGTLYHKVPSWPIAYRDDKKAQRFLKKALDVSPESAHTQFYYAEYLASKGEKEEAIDRLYGALDAAHQSEDVFAQARGLEIEEALNKLGG
ncbi:MAG: hypothetical protein CMF48_02480 [Legionellales bacterium]|nr:hypothetical protein [Legionellales bacterium]